IMLTSLTTFAGVLPLLSETSTQAQLLIPMAASLGFGVIFATIISLVLVPALCVVRAPRPRSATQIGAGGYGNSHNVFIVNLHSRHRQHVTDAPVPGADGQFVTFTGLSQI